jgi:ribose transport system ATP-binding protein
MSVFSIEIRNIVKSFNEIKILNNASLYLEKGETLGILGKNASAKSTLVKILCGLIQPDSGEILIEGKPKVIRSPKAARQNGIIALHEEIQSFKSLNVAENIYFGSYRQASKPHLAAKLGIINWKFIRESAEKLCRQYDLDIDPGTKIKNLSIAQQQMIGILHAIVQNTRILLIDECLTAFDDQDLTKIKNILQVAKNSGTSIIITSQNPKIICSLSDSVQIIDDGNLSQRFSPEDMHVNAFNDQTGLFKNQPYPKLVTSKGPIFFSCRNICFRNQVREVSFDVRQGEILGIVGAAGAGKTTLARIMTGDIKPDFGVITINGKPVSIASPLVARKYQISLISDDTLRHVLIPYSSIVDNVSLNNYQLALMKHLPFVVKSKKLKSQSIKIINRLGITYSDPEQKVIQLSAGNQKKVAFSRAIISGAQLFLLDEPTIKIDNAGRIQIYNIMNELARLGKSIVFFTSDINEALGMCDKLIIMRDGKIVGEHKNTFATAEKVYHDLYE